MGKAIAGALIAVALMVGGYLTWQGVKQNRAAARPPAGSPAAMPVAAPPSLAVPGRVGPGTPAAPTASQPGQPAAPPTESATELVAKAKAAKTDADRYAIYDRLVSLYPESLDAAQVRTARVQYYRTAGDEWRLRNALSDLLWHGLADAGEAEIKKELDTLNKSLIFSHRESGDGKVYTLQPGDALVRIAKTHNVTPELLQRLNDIKDPRRIRHGDQIKLIDGPFDLFVELGKFRLTVLLKGHFVKEYKVGIGKDNKSPLGKFAVTEKLLNPTWYGEGEVIAADDPRNPLGERWIGISGGNGYGIHGTIEPQSVGSAASRGCIRMIEADVDEVYDFVVPKLSTVTIVK